MRGLAFRVLGPLDITRNGDAVGITGRRQRLLLALLLADAGHTIAAARLADALWGDDPPDDPMNTIQQYVAQLRKALEPDRKGRARDGVITTRPPGYRLDVEGHMLDTLEAENLIARAQACLASDRPAESVALAEQALRHWRGAPFEEFPDEPFLYATITRLDERRLDALEIATSADRRLGNDQQIVDRLGREHDSWPRRERLAIEYSSALVRTGRHPDAVSAAQTYRRALAMRGLEPSPELNELEAQILTHRAAPFAPPRPGSSAARVTPVLRRLLDQTPAADADIAHAPSALAFVEWHLAIAAAASTGDVAADADGWLRTHERHRAGYEASLEWAHEHRPELAAALALELARWWDWLGDQASIREHLGRALQHLDPEERTLRASATAWVAFSLAPDDAVAAEDLIRDALEIDDDPVRHAHTRCMESVIVRSSDPARAYVASRHAIDVFTRHDLPTELAYAHVTAALAAIELDDESGARLHAEHANDLYESLGDMRGKAWSEVLAHRLGRSDDVSAATEFARSRNDRATTAWLERSS